MNIFKATVEIFVHANNSDEADTAISMAMSQAKGDNLFDVIDWKYQGNTYPQPSSQSEAEKACAEDVNGPSEADDLNAQNELLKLQLEQEHGAVFGAFANDMPPEVENEFLRNVLEFERQHKAVGVTTMYEFLGSPTLYPPDELTEDDFRTEVKRLFELFEQHDVRLDVLGDYPAETIYRFIVNEFMHLEKDDIHIPGMYSGYIYEEFHPNHRLDIERRVRDLFSWLTDPDIRENFYGFDDTVEDHSGKAWTRTQFLYALREFRSSYGGYNLVRLDIETLEFNETAGIANVRALVEIEAFNTYDKFWFLKNYVDIELRCEYNYWSINKFKLPGLLD